MRYPALIDFDGNRLVADFPDCPGCEASVEADGDIVVAARAALHRWLETALSSDVPPPRPSIAVVSRDWFEWVDVAPELARRLLLRWVVARRLSRSELARRSGLSEDEVATLQDETVTPEAALLDGVARALGVVGGTRATTVAPSVKPDTVTPKRRTTVAAKATRTPRPGIAARDVKSGIKSPRGGDRARPPR